MKNVKNIIIIIIIAVVLLLAVIFGSIYVSNGYYFKYYYGDIYDQQADDYFSTVYNTTIYPNASIQISNILSEVSNISDPHEKLEAIAVWEVDGFDNFLSENSVKNRIGSYIYNENGKVRAYYGSKYDGDPYWITYYRYGACGELAYLFAYIANQSGFETHVISAKKIISEDNPEGTSNHAWVEVKINNEWHFYDPAQFYDYYPNITSDKMWSGKLDERKLWGWTLRSLVDENENDVHNRYDIPYI